MLLRAGSLITASLTAVQGLQRQPLPVSELAAQVRSFDDGGPAAKSLERVYPQHTLATPIDHFHNESRYKPHSYDTFNLRYWYDAQFYKPGGPVIVLCSGETSGVGRLPFLQKGIAHELAKATGGIGVILEHRYYGTSVPVDDFSTENLRFLTTEQALADTEYFAKHAKFEGVGDADLSPEATPWIAYGGSYAGSFAAFLRILYPYVFWGGISSSGVPTAIWDYWEYFEAARIHGPPTCVETTQKVTDVVDKILLNKENLNYVQQLKDVFGLGNLTHNDDFANTISRGISSLQGLNWDPAVSNNAFFDYCANISDTSSLYPDTEKHRDAVEKLLTVTGYADELDDLVNRTLNYIGWVDLTTVSHCKQNQDECFSAHDSEFYTQDDISQTWRLWIYQVCTEWGYLQTGSGVPSDQLPLISRAIDLEYSAIACREAFNLTKPAEVERINKFGAFNISYPRLAFVDGEWDPWLGAGAHAPAAPERKSTMSEPFILIEGGVHHWDENGLFPEEITPELPPAPVADAKRKMEKFVKDWLKDWPSQDTSAQSGPSDL